VERTNAWHNGFNRLQRCYERNEDVIDLYSRVKQGTVVVVLEPKQGDSPYNSKMALQGGGTSGPMPQ